MGLEDYFNKAREFLKSLNYPTLDAITPLDKYMHDDIGPDSECFAIHFVRYLEETGVLVESKQGYELSIEGLGDLEFDLYKSYVEQCVERVNPLRKLLQES